MPLSWNEIRSRAHEFSRRMAGEESERAESQTFWNEFFAVFGIDRKRVAVFGVFQGSCRIIRFHYAASETGNAGRSGFSITAPTGSQFRVFPDHRSGRFAFAAS